MAFELDPEIAPALVQIAGSMADVTPPSVGDVQTRRMSNEDLMATTGAAQPMLPQT